MADCPVVAMVAIASCAPDRRGAGGDTFGLVLTFGRVEPTFDGADPDTTAASTVCASTPTKCQARTRLYRDGVVALEGLPTVDGFA